jgi:hypothetical protein
MFIIKMKFVGKDGTYTIEEESATDEIWACMKKERILKRWHNILCQSAKIDDCKLLNTSKINSDLLLKIINFNLSLTNDGSTFEISMNEV